MLPRRVKIVEVGPRDGLQNEAAPVPTHVKLAFIRALVDAGLKHVEVTSFVHPKAVPQLADAAEVIAGLPKGGGVEFSALVPNERGLERALQAGIRRMAVFTAASETFTRKNIGMGIHESLDVFSPVVKRAIASGVSVRGYVSTAFVCPFEGRIAKERVRDVATQLIQMNVDEVAISDTIGAAVPTDVASVVEFVVERIPVQKLALHFHDTYGTALANVFAGLQAGVSTFDSSAGGLGGCPFAPGAAGNLATEDLVYMLDGMGIETAVSLQKVIAAANVVAGPLGRQLPSRQWVRLRQAAKATGM
jgi:isopropylmalate/homocitrate/citramalate synthase